MCGILGFTGNKTGELLPELRSILSHRGPNNADIFQDIFLSLSHTRLSILDLSSNANQPMVSQDGNYVIVYNGEIYNHLDIRKELEKKYSFKSTSDTETLLYGFIEYGKEILNKLNGIFAFAIYNKTTGDLFLARDPFGVKPLYYYHKDFVFLFSSELKALTDYPSLDKKINHSSLLNYIGLLYSPGENTPFTQIKKLEAGHYLEINVQKPDQLKIEKYYTPAFKGIYSKKTETQWIQQLEEQLLAAVERQMLSDIPVGFFLSGGLDSSSLVALAKSIYPDRKIQCFTLETKDGYQEEGFVDDLTYARKVATHLNVDLEEVKGSKDLLTDFESLIYQLDEPLADPAALHTWNISLKAKEMGYKVLISGTGSDEIFSGYRRHQAVALEKYFQVLPAFLIQGLTKILSLSSSTKSNIRRLKKLVSSYHPDQIQRLISYFYWLPEADSKKLFKKDIQEELKDFHSSEFFQELLKEIPEEHSALNKMLYLDLNTYSIDNNLLYTDRMSMATGVEVRVPFLDKELVEFNASIPPELKMKGTTTKYLLRKVMEKYLPSEIISRPKTGFGAPVRKWIVSGLEPKVHEYLSPEALNKRGIFDPNAVWTLIEDNKKGKVDAAYSIYALLAIEGWMRKYVDNK